MQDDEIRRIVLETLCAVVPEAEGHEIDAKVNFRDQLEVDSVDFLNLVTQLEERLGLRVPELDYPRLACLDGCIGYLAPLVGCRG
jgi:acyl carrier protein